MADRLWTAKQVATYLNVNQRTVTRLVAEGALPGVKVGHQWRFRKAMIDTWLDNRMLRTTPQSTDTPHGKPRARTPLLRARREAR